MEAFICSQDKRSRIQIFRLVLKNSFSKKMMVSVLPALCFLPLFQGVFPLFALEILSRLNRSFSSNSFKSPLEDASWSSEVLGVWGATPNWEFLNSVGSPIEMSPFPSWSTGLDSRVATALIKNPRLELSGWTLKFTRFGITRDFQEEDNSLSFPKVSEPNDLLTWNHEWAVEISATNARKGIYKVSVSMKWRPQCVKK